MRGSATSKRSSVFVKGGRAHQHYGMPKLRESTQNFQCAGAMQGGTCPALSCISPDKKSPSRSGLRNGPDGPPLWGTQPAGLVTKTVSVVPDR